MSRGCDRPDIDVPARHRQRPRRRIHTRTKRAPAAHRQRTGRNTATPRALDRHIGRIAARTIARHRIAPSGRDRSGRRRDSTACRTDLHRTGIPAGRIGANAIGAARSDRPSRGHRHTRERHRARIESGHRAHRRATATRNRARRRQPARRGEHHIAPVTLGRPARAQRTNRHRAPHHLVLHMNGRRLGNTDVANRTAHTRARGQTGLRRQRNRADVARPTIGNLYRTGVTPRANACRRRPATRTDRAHTHAISRDHLDRTTRSPGLAAQRRRRCTAIGRDRPRRHTNTADRHRPRIPSLLARPSRPPTGRDRTGQIDYPGGVDQYIPSRAVCSAGGVD